MKRFQYLDYTYEFWARFVKGNDLDAEGLLAAGFTKEQFDGIRQALTDNEYLKSDAVKALESQKVGELKKLAEDQDVELPTGAHKPEIVEALADAGVEPPEKKGKK